MTSKVDIHFGVKIDGVSSVNRCQVEYFHSVICGRLKLKHGGVLKDFKAHDLFEHIPKRNMAAWTLIVT